MLNFGKERDPSNVLAKLNQEDFQMTDTYKREKIKAKKARVKDPNCETHHNAT